MLCVRSLVRRLIVVVPIALALMLAPVASATSPTITSLSPSSAYAGGAGFTMIINGDNFNSTSFCFWQSVHLESTYVSPTQLSIWVPLAMIATAGSANIVVQSLGGAGASAASIFTIYPPPPAISSLTPTSASVGGSAFTLTIVGKNFTATSAALWGITPLATTFISATQLAAVVPAGLIATAGTASLTVTTAVGVSSPTVFTINPPPPTITSLTPSTAVSSGATFTMTVNGTNFLPGSLATVVRWNYTALATTWVSSTQLKAIVPASLYAAAGTANVTVVTAGGISSGFPFIITQAPPIISTLSMTQIHAGFGAFFVNVYGTHFTPTSTVNWGSTPLVTTSIGGSTLSAAVTADLVAAIASVSLTVSNAGGTSAPVKFTITPPLPLITSLIPSSAPAGSAAFTLIINGNNFNSTTFCWWQSIHLATTYISPTQLSVWVPVSMLATASTASVVIETLGGGGKSTSAFFTIKPTPPAITSLTPNTTSAGGAGFTLTIQGNAFTPGTSILWGTTLLGTIYISPTQLRADVPASLVENAGTASVTVSTAAGKSLPYTFTIKQAPPVIGGLGPSLATAGGAAFTLTITGNYFTAATTSKWGSTALVTTYVSQTQLTAKVPANLIATAGTAGISVSTSAGTSAPAAFTIYPTPKIIVAPLPSGTAGNAYSGTINVTSGVPGYTWTVTGLPSTLTYSNTSGSAFTISGTPTSVGTISFQVSVQDTVGNNAGPVAFTINVAAGANAAKNSRLNGSYVCLLQGSIDIDQSRWATILSFQADGQGHFTNGVFDTNSHDIGSASGIVSGTYNINSDNNGLASIHTILTDGAAGIQTLQWAVALTSAAQPAQQFRMVEDDDLGALPSGQQGTANCYRADTSAFAASTINGSSFVFGLDGEDNNSNLKAAVGTFTTAGGLISSGAIDSALGGNSTVQTSSFIGRYTAPDPASGRFTLALKGSGIPTGFTAYIIDANRFFILDDTWNQGEQAGNMRTLQQASYSGASVSEPFVLYLRGAEFNIRGVMPSGYYSYLYRGIGDGAGNIAFNQSYTNHNGAYTAGNSSSVPIALTFDSAHSNRANFQSANGTTYLYMYDNNSALVMSVGNNGSLDSGWFEPQRQTIFTDSSLAGNYLYGALPLLNLQPSASLGVLALPGNGAINAAVTTTGRGNLSWDQTISTSYHWDTSAPNTGTFLVANGAQGAASCAVINSTKYVCSSQTDSSPTVQVMEQ